MNRLALLMALLPAAALADGSIERRLYSDRVDSSSFLWNDWNKFQENYHPLYAVDGDPTTAWVEGAEGTGEGEWIRIGLTPLSGTTAVRLRLRNGYQKSTALYKANARAREITVKLLPSGVSTRASLTDTNGWQELRIDQPSGLVEAVELKVSAVYPGSKYADLCLSDVEVYATSTTPDNPAAEKARYDRLLGWKKERLAAAALFRTATAGQIPLATAYHLRAEPDPPVALEPGPDPLVDARAVLDLLATYPSEPGLPRPDAAIELARTALVTRFAGWSPVQAVATDTRPIPTVDGLEPARLWSCYDGAPVWADANSGDARGAIELPLAGQLGFLRADTVGTFALADPPTLEAALAGEPARCSAGDLHADPPPRPHTYAWAKLGAATADHPARVEALWMVSCGRLEVRDGIEKVVVPQLLVYDEQGRLDLLVGKRAATAFGWRGDGPTSVLSDGRRVGIWATTVRLREGPRPR